jgi:SAM-dependent methyltransferase
VARRLSLGLFGFESPRSQVSILRDRFDAHAPIDYDDFARTFAHRYYLRNYWKAIFALRDADLPLPSTVLDLGAGSGAATAATLAWAYSKGPLPMRMQAVLLDRSEHQLSIARRLLTSAADRMPGLSFSVTTLKKSLSASRRGWVEELSGADLVLASHFLTENIDAAPALYRTMRESLPASARLLVLERADDPVWSRLPAQGARSFHVPDRELLLHRSSARRGEGRISARYLLTTARERTLVDLAERYFMAWREQSVDQLDHVFSADACYQDQPHRKPMRSLAEIRGYWRRRVLPQQRPTPRVLHFAVHGGRAEIDWATEMTVDRRRKLVAGQMTLELAPCGERIGHLHESYSSRVFS